MEGGSGRGPVDQILAAPAMRRFIAGRSRRLSVLMKRSGEVGNPVALAAGTVRGVIRGELLAVPAAALLAAFVSPLFFCISALPLAGLLVPEVRFRDRAAQRREGVERELPFFATFLGILGGAGISLYEVLKDVAGTDVFPSVKREALLVRRDVEIFGMDTNAALERLAGTHPSKKLSGFLLGYTSKARSGADVSAYLTSESGALLKELADGWASYVARVGVVGTMMVTVFGVVPLLLLVMGVFDPGFSVAGLAVYAGAGVPVLTAALLAMAGRMQPAQDEQVHGDALKGTMAACPAAVVGYLLGGYWVCAAAGLGAFFLAYGFGARRELAGRRGVDDGVSRFLRDLLEYKRQDYDLARAVVAIEAQGGYTGVFGRTLSRVAAQLKVGVPLDEVKADGGSRMGRLAFFLLGEMSRSGGGSVDTVFQVSSFADRLIELRRGAVAEIRPYLVLSYVAPVLLAFGVTFVGGVLSSFRAPPALEGGPIHFGGAVAVPPELSAVSNLLIIASAASLGLIGAKIADLTVRNTTRAALNVIIAAGAVAAMTILSAHSFFQVFAK